MAVASSNDVSDSPLLPELLDGIEGEIEQVSGDGAYDCRSNIENRGATPIIPPRKDAQIGKQGNRKHKPPPRNENLGRIHRIGKKRWKEESHYHRRDLAEATMFRFQTILGGQLRCRHIDNQAALNWMSHLGMPDSYLVES